MKYKILIVLFPVLLMGCENKEDLSTYPNPKQLVLFQVDRINFAWGPVHHGMLIDSLGNILLYNYPKIWHYLDNTDQLSEAYMNENIAQVDTLILLIKKGELFKYFDKVNAASTGELSDPTISGYDAGKLGFYGFMYDPISKIYKRVLIKEEGNYTKTNMSKEASEIYSWLHSIYYHFLPTITSLK